ncbi:N-formylglutamate amidohydrolase [Acidomonas methanolica]|uniref:N-formylglutamate amidohydrolase n=1 Tax=Acidomonas methanolica NBRC 104435 TaxID=1231351 RepID=A0A023D5B9_ACIMT|nr:N-formylglutamate amidohydrolase [Acidomonas methanolica]GAJ28996.1 N-formylglutamate amidohydrolase [Acidomonas methanolica NBRC 104435]MBU2653243.1 N-formylglutamate amidohydrolase [Acidomonas methanolica]TCS32192.1 putative N-formylglutamate amidohydrolase [Acidomonas methanolica]GBQ50912.1 N-formylglutamate amidohydrolase [Acidomonas methanolica]GEK97626.1 N-formylglutamate amidohydrolase [Acidomonas methanolica NBRC 104435]
MALLSEDDPPPYIVHAAVRPSPFLLVADHAGRQSPKRLGDLGVSPEDWERHIAWDIGIQGVGRALHERLGATLIEQVYSRLVIDCNRSPGHPTSLTPVSDGTAVPANQTASVLCRASREMEILHPYHDRIAAELARRKTDGQPTALIALHSFTPRMGGADRPWHVGVLHHRDTVSARIMLDLLRADGDLCVGDNEPYVLTTTSDYTVPRHAEAAGLPYLELEIRQDLIAGRGGQDAWAVRLARLLPLYWKRLEEETQPA